MNIGVTEIEIRHFQMFCGLGGGARGFNRGRAQVGSLRARFRCIGGVDIDPAAVRDFQKLAGAPARVLDLFDREQYRDFHGAEPPAAWMEATPDDIRRAAGNERPHVVFMSVPWKGYSGLLPEAKSSLAKYQVLNSESWMRENRTSSSMRGRRKRALAATRLCPTLPKPLASYFPT
jgi:hypothetical protein